MDALCFCAGWKGWTSEQALHEDLNYIEAARTGHIQMLHVIFGGPEEADKLPAQLEVKATAAPLPDQTPIQLTPEIFDRLFGDQSGGNHA